MTDSDPPTADDLLGQTAWLRRFAVELVGAEAADDVAQETLLRALRWGGEARVWRPWLAQVARSVAWRWRRGESTRRRREIETARHESLPSTAETVASFAAHRAVVEAVSALDEPYRSTLLLRFWEDLPPREVARRMQVPVETVRTRIKRGCALVRAGLDQTHEGRNGWLVPLLGIPGLRDAVVTAMQGAGLSVSTPTLGGLVMSKAASFTGIAILLAAAGWWLWPRGAEGRSDQDPIGASGTPPAATTGGDDRSAAASGDAAGQEADVAMRQPASGPTSPGRLRVQVRLASGGPAADIGVYARAAASHELGVERRTSPQGEVVFDALPSGAYRVDLDRCPGTTAQVQPGQETLLPLAMPIGVRVEGRVVQLSEGRAEPNKQPVPGARVYAMAAYHHDYEQLLAVADATGCFTIDHVDRETALMARADGWQPSRPGRTGVGGKPGGATKVTLTLGGRGYRLRGRVLDHEGKPAALALVVIAVDEDSHKHVEGAPKLRQLDGDRKLDREGFFVRAGADGCFESAEVPWGDASVIARGVGAQRAQVGGVVVHVAKSEQAAEAVVRLQPGATLLGVARDDHGAPWAGLPLTLEWRGTPELGSIEHDRGHEMLDGKTAAAADGTFRFEGVLPGGYALEARLGRDTQRLETGELAAGMTKQVEVVVPRRSSLTVRVVDAKGQPLQGWAVDAAVKPHGTQRAKHTRTDACGSSRFEGLHDADHVVCVHAPDTADPVGFARFPTLVVSWPRQPAELVVTIPAAGSEGRLRGRIVDARGLPVRNRIEIAMARSDFDEHLNVQPDANGAFVAEPLPPGQYLVRSKSERSANMSFGPFEVLAGESKDLGELRLVNAAQLTVVLELPSEAALQGLQLDLVPEAGERRSLSAGKERSIYTSGSLLPGRWTLRLAGEHVVPQIEAVELAPGESKKLGVRCEVGVGQQLAVDCSHDPEQVQRGKGYVWLDLWDGNGRQVLAEHYLRGRLDGRGVFLATLRLLPGTYRAKLRGRSGRAELEMKVAGESGAPVTVPLR